MGMGDNYRLYVFIDGDIIICKPTKLSFIYSGDVLNNVLKEVKANGVVKEYGNLALSYHSVIHIEEEYQLNCFNLSCYHPDPDADTDRMVYYWLGKDENQIETFREIMITRLNHNCRQMLVQMIGLQEDNMPNTSWEEKFFKGAFSFLVEGEIRKEENDETKTNN